MATPTTHWEAQQLPPENVARLLALLFGPEADATPEVAPPTCGLNAAFDRIDRHLAWFDADAKARVA